MPEKYIETPLNGPPNNVPVITGKHKDESGASTSTNFTVSEYVADCRFKYGNLSAEYFKLYPANNDTQADKSWNVAARDTSLVFSWAFVNEWVRDASSPIWTYYWDQAPPNQTQGAIHQSEIYYILNSVQTSDDYPFDSYDLWLGDVM